MHPWHTFVDFSGVTPEINLTLKPLNLNLMVNMSILDS